MTQPSPPKPAKKSQFAETKKRNFHPSIMDESEVMKADSPGSLAMYNLQHRLRLTNGQGRNFETSGTIFNQAKCSRTTKNYSLPQKLRSLDILDPKNASVKNSQRKSFDTDIRNTLGVESRMEISHGNSQRAVLNPPKLGKFSVIMSQLPDVQRAPDSLLNVGPNFFITQYR
jgi:hypothetical protein